MGILEGKAALITGANGGLGSAVTEAFLSAGAGVAGLSRSIRQTEHASPNFLAIASELSSLDAANTAVRKTIDRFGRVDILVHLLGGWAGGTSVAATDDATFARMIEMNLTSSFHILRAILPPMTARRSGRILAIGSKAAVEPMARSGAYNASKAALVSLIRTVALETRNDGITANVVLPGTMDTPANRAAMPNADPSQWVQPAQIASLLVHLASDAAAQVSGAVIPVYGPDL